MVNVRNLTVCDFERRIKEEKVICVCVGQGLRELCEKYPLLPAKIIYAMDNFGHGKDISINDYQFPVYSMNRIDERIRSSLIVITSIQYADEIIRQMDTMKSFDGIDVYIPHLFTDEYGSMVLEQSSKAIIPKKIHYCWFGKSVMPKQFQKNIETWEKNCPDYEIIRWDESNYDYTKNKYMKQAYETRKWGFVPDYARLDIINTYGGIYLDTDVELLRTLDPLLSCELFCGFESPNAVAFGLGFGGVANHIILQEMMEQYESMDFIQKDGTLNLIASPIYQTQILERHGLIKNGRCQNHKNFMVFSPEYFAPINAYGLGQPTENSFSIHQYAATWFGDEERTMKNRKIDCIRFIMERME